MSDQACTCNRCPQCGGILPPTYWPVYPAPYYPAPVYPAPSWPGPIVPTWYSMGGGVTGSTVAGPDGVPYTFTSTTPPVSPFGTVVQTKVAT